MAKVDLTSDEVYASLLRRNYFPMSKRHLDEMPPVFHTDLLDPNIANKLIDNFKNKRKRGFDQIEYRVTRFDNVTRVMHIPVPLPYAELSKCVAENWTTSEFQLMLDNPSSQIKPGRHKDDRIVILGDYEDLNPGRISVLDPKQFPRVHLLQLEMSSTAGYLARADISSFFHSIYTHSIPWALVGHDVAKQNKSTKKWFNKLDKLQRLLKRDETQGIPIGPATSHVMAELILSKVDSELRERNHVFVRFIDDCKCFAPSKEKAEAFLSDLEQELRKYLLNLNASKVAIQELPQPVEAPWISDISTRRQPNIPSSAKRILRMLDQAAELKRFHTEQSILQHSALSLAQGIDHSNAAIVLNSSASAKHVLSFLDYAITLQKQHPEGSVLKYAARSLTKNIDRNNAQMFLSRLASMSFRYPVLLPIVCQVAQGNREIDLHKYAIKSVEHHVNNHRSDAICWALFLVGISNKQISADLADKVVETRDCMAMGMLISLNQHEDKIIRFLEKSIDPSVDPPYDCDRYWILIHELSDKLSEKFKKYLKECGFDFLREREVHFIKNASEVIGNLATKTINAKESNPDGIPS